MMELCDVHFHLNLKKENPIQDMLDQMQKYHIKALVLILNSAKEFDTYIDACLSSDIQSVIHPAVLLDIHDPAGFHKQTQLLYQNKLSYSIKLHPRMNNIQKKDFYTIETMLAAIEYKNIIVDSFYYGHRLENLIYSELAIFLAEKFKSKKIVMAHFGGVKIMETMLLTRKLPNIYYDLSCTINYFVDTSVWKDIFHCINKNVDRVMYGSDYPEFTEGQTLDNLKHLFSQFGGTVELFEKITGSNGQKVFFDKER